MLQINTNVHWLFWFSDDISKLDILHVVLYYDLYFHFKGTEIQTIYIYIYSIMKLF